MPNGQVNAVPRSTNDVVHGLQDQGFVVNLSYTRWLMNERHLERPVLGPGNVMLWFVQNVNELKAQLCQRGRAPLQAMQRKAERIEDDKVVVPTLLVAQG